MAANIPDMGAISNLGGQFHHNVFQPIQKKITDVGKKAAASQAAQAQRTAQARDTFSRSAERGVYAGRKAVYNNQVARMKAGQAQAKTMQQQRNYAHGEAIKENTSRQKAMQQQVNNAHSQALKMSAQKASGKATTPPAAPSSTPTVTPSFSSAPATHTPIRPTGPVATNFSSQLTPHEALRGSRGSRTADFIYGPQSATPASTPAPQTGVSSAQFPQHTHPEGSSQQPLPHLTASQPKPNTFTTGSRNARPGGIAARGSQLEAWAMGRQQQIREQRQSGE
jgi:hypothetical protein